MVCLLPSTRALYTILYAPPRAWYEYLSHLWQETSIYVSEKPWCVPSILLPPTGRLNPFPPSLPPPYPLFHPHPPALQYRTLLQPAHRVSREVSGGGASTRCTTARSTSGAGWSSMIPPSGPRSVGDHHTSGLSIEYRGFSKSRSTP